MIIGEVRYNHNILKYSVTVQFESLTVLTPQLFDSEMTDENIPNLSYKEEFLEKAETINDIVLPFMNRKFQIAEYGGNTSFHITVLIEDMSLHDWIVFVRRHF